MTFYMPKLVLIGSLWLLVVSLSLWQEFKQLRDPTYDYQFDTGYAMVCLPVCVDVLSFKHCEPKNEKLNFHCYLGNRFSKFFCCHIYKKILYECCFPTRHYFIALLLLTSHKVE